VDVIPLTPPDLVNMGPLRKNKCPTFEEIFKGMKRNKVLIILWLLLVAFPMIQLGIIQLIDPGKYPLALVLGSPVSSFITGLILLFGLIIPVFDATTHLPVKRKVFLFTLMGMVYSVTYILILIIFLDLFEYGALDDYGAHVINFALKDFHNVMKNYLFKISLIAFDYFSRENRLLEQTKNLEIELNRTKLQTLKSQLQPHFLFNALNSVVSVIDENKQKAQDMLVGLSDILRTTLNTDFAQLSTLGDELVFIKSYLQIEKARYEDQLHFSIEVSEEAKRLRIPGLILQPIIENAIKHGFKGIQRRLNIIVSADAGRQLIWVKNDGAPLDQLSHQNTGIKNVSERLSIFYPHQKNFRIYQDQEWVINEIQLA